MSQRRFEIVPTLDVVAARQPSDGGPCRMSRSPESDNGTKRSQGSKSVG
jgi:hypothetical protein